jgi:hypothetical protein
MKQKHNLLALLVCLGSISLFTDPLRAQDPALTATILHQDSLFWKAYNNCDVAGMSGFFTDDIEFYHDKGGLTVGLSNFKVALQQGLCGEGKSRLRRVAVDGTVQVFPMANNKVVYGAILSGEHVFYVKEAGKDEYLDGHAKFTHVWLLKDGVWKMARVLSYSHGPAK